MRVSITLNDDNVIKDFATGQGALTDGFNVDVPDDFDREILTHCRYIDGEFIPFEPPKVPEPPTAEERLAAMEEALLGLMLGG